MTSSWRSLWGPKLVPFFLPPPAPKQLLTKANRSCALQTIFFIVNKPNGQITACNYHANFLNLSSPLVWQVENWRGLAHRVRTYPWVEKEKGWAPGPKQSKPNHETRCPEVNEYSEGIFPTGDLCRITWRSNWRSQKNLSFRARTWSFPVSTGVAWGWRSHPEGQRGHKQSAISA